MPLNAFRPTSPTDRFSRTKRYELTLLVCAIAWLITETLYGKIATANLAMIFLLAVLVVAVNLGRNPAIFAVVLCVSAFDFLYVPPRFSFAINDFQYLITLVVMLVTAIVTAHLAASLREKAHDAQRREANTYALYDLTRELAGAATWAEAQAQVTSFLQRQLGAQSLMLRADADGEFGAIAEGSALRIDRILARVVMKSHEFVRDVEDRGADSPDPHRVSATIRTSGASRKSPDAAQPAARYLGANVYRKQPLPARLRRALAPQARAGSRATATPADGDRRRLPFPALRKLACINL